MLMTVLVYIFGRSGELWLAIRFAGRVIPFAEVPW